MHDQKPQTAIDGTKHTNTTNENKKDIGKESPNH